LSVVFLDTSVILNPNFKFSEHDKCYLSIVSIEEIDNLKTNDTKGHLARQAIRKIIQADNLEIKLDYSCTKSIHRFLDHKNDNTILSFFMDVNCKDKDCILITDDYGMLIKCRALGLPCQLFDNDKNDIYKGYKEIILSDLELADYYQKTNNFQNLNNIKNEWDLLINEYLLLKDDNGKTINKIKWTEKGFKSINTKPFKSIYFPDFKPKDEYQMMAMDSLINDDLTLLFGKAGTAKTMLSLSWIMQNIHMGKIGTCVIGFNPVKLKNSEALGFYSGNRNEKLLQNSIGGILSSKLGSMDLVNSLISNNKLMLIPTSDIRGIEVSDQDCIFVTEAQNIDSYTAKTIIQRAKEGCKVIIEGDILEQQDIRNSNLKESGMYRIIEVFKGDTYFSCVKLKNIYRGHLADVAQSI